MNGQGKLSDEPDRRLTRICEGMTDTLTAHPEQPGDRISALVVLDDDEAREGGAVMHGYNEPLEALAHLLRHVEAMAKASEIPIAIVATHTIGGEG